MTVQSENGVWWPAGPLSQPLVAGAMAAAVAVLVAVVSLEPGSSWAQAVGDLALVSASLSATLACIKAARRRDQASRAWAFMAAATGTYCSGAVIRTWYGFTRGHDYPFPSLADVGFLGYALPAALALLSFPRNGEQLVSRLRVTLDGLVIASSLLFVSWGTVLGPLYASGGTGVTRFVTLAYPALDITIASLVIALGVRARPEVRGPWLLVGGGWVLLTVTDSTYVWLLVHGVTGLTGTVWIAGWVSPFLLIALAARTSVSSPHGGPRRTFTVTQELLPHVPVLAAVLVAAHLNVFDGEHPLLLGIGAWVVLLVVVHQVVIAFEKTTLANGLEQLVTDRTSELEEFARRTELLLNSAGDGIYGVDAWGRITFVNPAASRVLGYDAQELIGLTGEVLAAESEGAGHQPERCPVTVAMRTGAAQYLARTQLKRRNGTLVEVEQTASPILREGQTTGAVVTLHDITKRREIERLKEEFTSMVSHELRTPLTSIRGALGLLSSGAFGSVPDKGQRMLDIAVSNTDRLVRLINDILDLERIESGAIELHRQRTGVELLLTQAMEAMEAMAAEASVTMSLAPVAAEVWADPDRVMQVLTNLLSNAIKFSPPGGVIELSAQRRGADIMFCVADQGRGVPSDHLERIFEPFHQVDSSDSRDKGGTGLGLPICRQIVEQHDGLIWVTSTTGQGSTFFFTLPAYSSVDEAVPAVAPGEGPAVLVCDDDPSVLEIVSNLLTRNGYRPVLAASGEEALTLAARERPIAVLLDLLMPGMGGWETAARLRALPTTADIPVVVCTVMHATGAGMPTEVQMAGWVDKPVDEESIVQALDIALTGVAEQRLAVTRVLVVEDDPDLARILVAASEKHGLEAVHATTGAEAMSLSQRLLPDLLVLDLMLPDSDGFAVVDWLRRHDRLRVVPLVVYTAQELGEAERNRLRLGEAVFLTKGRISESEFEERITGLLSQMTVTS